MVLDFATCGVKSLLTRCVAFYDRHYDHTQNICLPPENIRTKFRFKNNEKEKRNTHDACKL